MLSFCVSDNNMNGEHFRHDTTYTCQP